MKLTTSNGIGPGESLPQDTAGSIFWRWLRISGLGLVMLFLVGFAAGFTAGHLEDGGAFDLRLAGVIGLVILCVAGWAWLLMREMKAARPAEPLTAKERLNRNILIACAAIGGVMGVAMSLTGDLASGGGMFSNDPLPTGFAIFLVVVLGLLVPAISVYWHRHAVDEQEADAYKSGALAALYVYMIGAPVWWIAWRGGFAPEPNGIVIYMATITVMCIVWLRKKYG